MMAQFTSILILLTSLLPLVNSTTCPTPSQESTKYENNTSLLDIILARGYLKVGTTGDYRPFSYLLPNSTFIGADISQAHSLSTALSLPNPPQFILTSFANLTSDLEAGKFDIAMGGISITPLRAQKFFFSRPYQRVGQAAITLCPDIPKFSAGLEDIDQADVRVAVNAGGENERFDRANLHSATLVVVQENRELYKKLLSGEADVVISDMVEVMLEARLSGGKLCVVNEGKPFNFVQKGYAMPRDGVWKSFVDVWLRIAVEGGEWNGTLGRWLEYLGGRFRV